MYHYLLSGRAQELQWGRLPLHQDSATNKIERVPAFRSKTINIKNNSFLITLRNTRRYNICLSMTIQTSVHFNIFRLGLVAQSCKSSYLYCQFNSTKLRIKWYNCCHLLFMYLAYYRHRFCTTNKMLKLNVQLRKLYNFEPLDY